MKGRKPHMKMDKEPVTTVLAAPSWLSKDAQAEWKRVMPILVQRRILTHADLGSLENYCIATGQARQCERLLQKHGQVMETEDGSLKRNPAVGIQKEALTQARLYASELGLTPVSRSRPTIREDDDDHGVNPLDIS